MLISVADNIERPERHDFYRGVRQFYFVEALASHAANLLLTGIFFYTHQQYQWGVRQNLTLAAGQGAVYVVGALMAGRLAAQLGRRNVLLGLQVIMMLLAVQAWLTPRPLTVVLVLMVYTALSSTAWPALESLVSQRASGQVLAKRLAMYNLVWSGTNALTLAISGSIIQHWPGGIFILVAAAHLFAMGILLRARDRVSTIAKSEPAAAAHLEPEPALLRVRTQALWLSRIALPSTYVVVYSLSAMLPSLAVMQPLPTQWRTIVGSVWFVARFATFAVLGATTFWHTRPRLMLAAAAVMLVAFIGTTERPSDWFTAAHVPRAIDVLSMISWQILLGAAMGIIYSASLYFGMVLSAGSTEHGGYHEALIGFGSFIGPGSAVAADLLFPGRIGAGISAVAGVIGLSLIAAAAAAAFRADDSDG
ncbi:MAG TPA: MFS transporter [Tepidisphaeraceae bacterium]|nr:MFS transporter [Tepidisphaeraceae bacterium]